MLPDNGVEAFEVRYYLKQVSPCLGNRRVAVVSPSSSPLVAAFSGSPRVAPSGSPPVVAPSSFPSVITLSGSPRVVPSSSPRAVAPSGSPLVEFSGVTELRKRATPTSQISRQGHRWVTGVRRDVAVRSRRIG